MRSPAENIQNLEQIDKDLAERGPSLESSAEEWFKAKREREKKRAVAFLSHITDPNGKPLSVAERNAIADSLTADIGAEHEAIFEARKAAVKVLDTRATINQSLLNAAKIGLNV